VAQGVAFALIVALPGAVLPLAVRAVIVVVALAVLLPLLIVNPSRLRHSSRRTRRLGVSQAGFLGVVALAVVALTVVELVTAPFSLVPRVLVGAVQAWLLQVVAASLVLWQLDRGGPVARRAVRGGPHPSPDLRFPQEDLDEHWLPSYVDYVGVALTNAMAVVPSRTLSLRPRTTLLTSLWSFTSFALIGVVVARIVAYLV
jgi:hypothetical protein